MLHSASICNGIKCSTSVPGSCCYTHLKKCRLCFHKHIENARSISQLMEATLMLS